MELKANAARQLACESALDRMKKCIEDTAEKGLQQYEQWHNMGDDAMLYTKAELQSAGYTVIVTRHGNTRSYYWNITW